MSIDIETNALNVGRLYARWAKSTASSRRGGFASKSVGENAVHYIIINRDWWVRLKYRDLRAKGTRKHEYEHIKNKLFRAAFEHLVDGEKTRSLSQRYQVEQDPEVEKTLLEEHFRNQREIALEWVEEALASPEDKEPDRLDPDLSVVHCVLRNLAEESFV